MTTTAKPTLKAPNRWLYNPVKVVVVGAGGNGSEVLDCLSCFHQSMLALGHEHGLSVTVIDDGIVRESNLVRQRFWPCDLGQFKAVSLVNRYNLMMGLNWQALPFRAPEGETLNALQHADLIITAVDLPSARACIGRMFTSKQTHSPKLWLDLGNAQRHGQAVLGYCAKNDNFPNVLAVYPEIESMEDDNSKSCSTAESIARQDCLINRAIATAGMTMVWELLRKGETDKHWIVLNLESGEQLTFPFPSLAKAS